VRRLSQNTARGCRGPGYTPSPRQPLAIIGLVIIDHVIIGLAIIDHFIIGLAIIDLVIIGLVIHRACYSPPRLLRTQHDPA
jgi:hypothetical protein